MDSIHGYFKDGDIVKNEGIWGDTLFVVHGFHGNKYQPLLSVHFANKPICNKNTCNFVVSETKLMISYRRPFIKLKQEVIIKLTSKGNVEAKRELIIRSRKNK